MTNGYIDLDGTGEREPTQAEALAASQTFRRYTFEGDVVDLRDWDGLDLTGSHDNSAILQAAIDQGGYPTTGRIHIPVGRVGFASQLVTKQNTWIDGIMQPDRGSELWWFGPDGVDAITTPGGVSPGTAQNSYLKITRIGLRDKRTSPTGGRGIAILNNYNYTYLKELFVANFPAAQIYVGASSGISSDCVIIDDVWATAVDGTPGAYGIHLERIDNYCSVRNIKSDLSTPPANGGAVILVDGLTNDAVVLTIDIVKHESKNKCPTIVFPTTNRGNTIIKNVIQRNPVSGQSGAGDIIRVGTSGVSGSSGGRRISLENITGQYHSDATGATGAAVVNDLATGQKTYGPLLRADISTGGRTHRTFSGNGNPNSTGIRGNIGDEFSSLDATIATYPKWIKRTTDGEATDWWPVAPQGYHQSVAYAASVTPVWRNGDNLTVGDLTGDLTVAFSNAIITKGQQVAFYFKQDSIGGRAVTYAAQYKGAPVSSAGTASQSRIDRFIYDGANFAFLTSTGWY